MPANVQNCCLVRGVEYKIRLNIDCTKAIFALEATNTMTQLTWKGIFSAEIVARLTSQAGFLKNLSTFTAMLRAAILNSSKSVHMDILTPDGLAKFCRSKTVSDKVSEDPRFGNSSGRMEPERLYFTLTYRTEFEECRYPLPLDLQQPKHNDRVRHRERSVVEDDEFDKQKIAIVDLETEIKSLRIENRKLRDALEDEETIKKASNKKQGQEINKLKRQLELQLSSERTKFQKQMQQTTRQCTILTKNLTLSTREIDGLKIQVRRLQAESVVYKRNLSSRTSPVAAKPLRTKCYSKPAKTVSPLPHRSTSRLNEADLLKDPRARRQRFDPSPPSSVYERYKQSRECLDRRRVETPRETRRIQPGPYRYHSADRIYRESEKLCALDQRSCSYSGVEESRFTVIKTLPTSGSRTNSQERFPRRPINNAESRSGWMRQSQYRCDSGTLSPSRSLRRSPVRAERFSRPCSNISTRSSTTANRYQSTAGGLDRTLASKKPVNLKTRAFSPTLSINVMRSVQVDHSNSRGSTKSPLPTNKFDRLSRDLSNDRSRVCSESRQLSADCRPQSRDLSPSESFFQKYKRKAKEEDAVQSSTGVQFRDLLVRLQGLSNKFPDSPRVFS